MKKKKKAGAEGSLKDSLRKGVLDVLQKKGKRPLNYKQIAKFLHANSAEERKLIISILQELKGSNKIKEEFRGKYFMKREKRLLEGRIELTSQGSAFVICEESEDDIFIPPRAINHALDGDTVRVNLKSGGRGNSREGEVVEIIERARTEFVGKLKITEKTAFLIADNRKMHVDIYIPKDKLAKGKDGDKAVVKITEWSDRYDNPFGEVVEVLGPAGNNDVEIHAIMAEFNLPYNFPAKVIEAADRVAYVIPPEEIAKRRDFRKITTFTIDPVDAKDFDDALSVNYLKNGNIEVGIHIADVSYYVHPKTILDKEALARGNSVYLVDRVVPMLPENISNGVCSLRPNEDKLCFSAVFELTMDCAVVKEWFGRTVIHSIKRFAYEDAQALIEGADGELKKEVLLLDKLAKIMRERRMQNGALEINSKEVRFSLDKDGNPLGTFVKESKDANKLIEEFMLLANKRVAELVGKVAKNKPARPFLYRIHDEPDPEKLLSLSQMVKVFGYDLKVTHGIANAADVRLLTSQIKGTAEEHILETMIIRSMSKAIYTADNAGHFGLAFAYYTHFTSPIRRYPDLIVHRLLAQYLAGQYAKDEKEIEVIAKHCSLTEKKAAEAERQSIKFKQVQFMLDRIGQEFWGVVSGITKWGVYVELVENYCEGMIHVSNLEGDRFQFDESKYQMIGSRTRQVIKLGDKLKIQVTAVDMAQRQIDFDMIEREDVD